MGSVIAALLMVLLQSGPSSMEQVGSPVRDLGPGQVGAPQVGAATRNVRAPQITTQPRSAAASPPLSQRAEGRPSPSVAIGGSDRCDPARPPRPGCERVIERRSAEFPRPRPPATSPEGRLLGARPMASMSDARNAADAAARGQAEESAALQAAAMRATQEAEARALENALGRGAAEALSADTRLSPTR